MTMSMVIYLPNINARANAPLKQEVERERENTKNNHISEEANKLVNT